MVLSTLVTYLAVYAALTLAYVAVLVHLARRAAAGKPLPTPETPPSPAATLHAAE